jgi:hypothetical protein
METSRDRFCRWLCFAFMSDHDWGSFFFLPGQGVASSSNATPATFVSDHQGIASSSREEAVAQRSYDQNDVVVSPEPYDVDVSVSPVIHLLPSYMSWLDSQLDNQTAFVTRPINNVQHGDFLRLFL